MSMFLSSILRLMPSQLYERVGKWMHKSRSNINHKKHLSDAFTYAFFLASFYSENTKHIYFLAYTTKTQKHHYRIIFILLHCCIPYSIAYHILFYLHLNLVLDNHSVELGTQDKEIVLQVAWRRMIGAFSTVPREFNIKPWVPSWGKFTLATTLCT
jgi:hypothetical protein